MTRKALTYMKWGFFLMFFHITVGRIDLLPDFVGIFLILQAFRSQSMTETERRMCPLLVILGIDYLLHWLFAFDNELESLLVTVISTYVIYILLGEVASRVRDTQPEQADWLHKIRAVYGALQVLNYLFGAYNISVITMVLALGFLVLLLALLTVLFRIEPTEEEECENNGA